MTSPSKINIATFSAFGLTVIPEWHHEDLVSENERKSDRIQDLELANQGLRDRLSMITDQRELKATNLYSANEKIKLMRQENKSLEFNRTHNLLRIQQLQDQVEKTAQSDRDTNELIEGLNAHIATLNENVLAARKDLSAIQLAYRKTLAVNTALDLKLGEAIAELSKTELQYNEQTVQIAGLERSRKALLSDFDNSKQTVNISLDNHRIDMLKAWDNLELTIKGKRAS